MTRGFWFYMLRTMVFTAPIIALLIWADFGVWGGLWGALVGFLGASYVIRRYDRLDRE